MADKNYCVKVGGDTRRFMALRGDPPSLREKIQGILFYEPYLLLGKKKKVSSLEDQR